MPQVAMGWKDVAIGVGSFLGGLVAGVAVSNVRIEPDWARKVMSRITIGQCIAKAGQVKLQFIGVGKWEPDETGVARDAAYYLVWSVGQGVYDLQGHIELSAPSQTKNYYILEFYHAYTCPVTELIKTDLPYKVELEEPHLVVLDIYA
jgi:hypothetical protein